MTTVLDSHLCKWYPWTVLETFLVQADQSLCKSNSVCLFSTANYKYFRPLGCKYSAC